MKNRTITGLIVAAIFVTVAICSLKVHYLFFDALVLLLMIMSVFEIRRAIKDRLGEPVLFLVLYVCCFGYAGFYILNNIGKRDPMWGTGVYLMIISSAILINFLYQYILRKNNENHQMKIDQGELSPQVSQNEAPLQPEKAQEKPKSNQVPNYNNPVSAVSFEDFSAKTREGEAEKAVKNKESNSGEATKTPVLVEILTTAKATAMTLIYPCVFLILMLSINYLKIPYRGIAIILLFLVSSFTDVFAYFVGSTLKGKKLCPSISPKKTISGAVGGIFGGLIGGAIVILFTTSSAFSWLELGGILGGSKTANVIHCLMLGLGGSICTQAGDLVASYIKRKCQIKDFGHLLPGHGGVMDRIDGMILNACFIFVYMSILAF